MKNSLDAILAQNNDPKEALALNTNYMSSKVKVLQKRNSFAKLRKPDDFLMYFERSTKRRKIFINVILTSLII